MNKRASVAQLMAVNIRSCQDRQPELHHPDVSMDDWYESTQKGIKSSSFSPEKESNEDIDIDVNRAMDTASWNNNSAHNFVRKNLNYARAMKQFTPEVRGMCWASCVVARRCMIRLPDGSIVMVMDDPANLLKV